MVFAAAPCFNNILVSTPRIETIEPIEPPEEVASVESSEKRDKGASDGQTPADAATVGKRKGSLLGR